LKKYYCIVLVELQDLKPGTEVSLETLFAVMGQSECNNICSEIAAIDGRDILIWLEGWDELDESFVHHPVFKSLLFGKVLPKATIVITTRPLATRSLKRFNFMHKFKLIGFTPEQRKKYVDRYCANDLHSNLAKMLMAHLNTVPGLSSFAEVPLYLAILVKVFKSKQQLPKRLTDIYCSFLMICL